MDSRLFVGQAKKKNTGLSQKEQGEMLEDFSKGEFNCLVSTSVAEEGLDIPSVDLVVFYEPVPSAIRTIQRRGRTGRLEEGKIYVLVAEDTRDVGYRWSAHHKEKKMFKALENFKKEFSPNSGKKLEKNSDSETGFKVVVDHREKKSSVTKELMNKNVEVELETLEVGDYLVSGELLVEYKTVKDFVDSIIDGRLKDQLKSMRETYKPVIILEGEEDLYSVRKVHPNSIRGMITTILLSYHIPIIRTKDHVETAEYIKFLARKEQSGVETRFQYHSSKPSSSKEIKEYVVSSLPGIGNALAEPLLKKFNSVKNVVNADKEELQEVELIGEKKAERIREVLDNEYNKKEK